MGVKMNELKERVEAAEAERDRLRAEHDFWKDRYDVQHRKVHVMEDEILRLREQVEELRKRLTWISDPSYIGNYAPLEVIEIYRKWAVQALEIRGGDRGAPASDASGSSGGVERLDLLPKAPSGAARAGSASPPVKEEER
jgi:hypothetical protein